MAKNKNVETIKQGEKVPIKFHISSSIITRFASNMLIQTLENEFKVSFFELKPEIRLGPSEKVPDSVLADCVASVIVTVDKMPIFIKALQLQLDKYNRLGKHNEKEKKMGTKD